VLHERCGFRVVGVYHRHGKLDGAWRDCVIVEKLLDDVVAPGPDRAPCAAAAPTS
jgi:phosphinothricin acetyltransferase